MQSIPRSPSSFNMRRGDSHEYEDVIHTSSSNINNNVHTDTLSRGESFSVRVKNALRTNVGGGCIPATTATNNVGDGEGHDDLYSIIADVPFFPPHHDEDQEGGDLQQQKSLHREEELVVDFPSRHANNNNNNNEISHNINQQASSSLQTNNQSSAQNQTTNHNASQHQSTTTKHHSLEEEQSTFPGFALYTMARVFYITKQYTRALDTTTECLAFQKKALTINDANSHTPSTTSHATHSPSSGSGLRNLIKTGIHAGGTNLTPLMIPTSHHPIVIATSTAKLLSHYPTHECVAQTLLLRARVLAMCGLYGLNNDEATYDLTLIHQAIQHLELSLAIQRKISTFTHVNHNLTQWELATPMILLGILKVEIMSYQEGELAYEEALVILQSVRQLHDDEREAATNRGDDEWAAEHSKISKRITREMANVYYLKGRSFQCRRRYFEAFECYNRGLELFNSVGVKRYSVGIRRIVRCMRRGGALEKLISDFWDDPNRI